MTQRSKAKTRRPLRVLLNSIFTTRTAMRVLETIHGDFFVNYYYRLDTLWLKMLS